MLNPEEILGFDKGFEDLATGCEGCSGSVTFA
jgi:hypothetical protein